jgi:hypothetical protein
MSFTVSKRVLSDLRRFRNHMCDSPSQIPCLTFAWRKDGARNAREFVLGAMNRQLCAFVGGCRILPVAHMDVAVILPKDFDLLEDVHLAYVQDQIVNVD